MNLVPLTPQEARYMTGVRMIRGVPHVSKDTWKRMEESRKSVQKQNERFGK